MNIDEICFFLLLYTQNLFKLTISFSTAVKNFVLVFKNQLFFRASKSMKKSIFPKNDRIPNLFVLGWRNIENQFKIVVICKKKKKKFIFRKQTKRRKPIWSIFPPRRISFRFVYLKKVFITREGLQFVTTRSVHAKTRSFRTTAASAAKTPEEPHADRTTEPFLRLRKRASARLLPARGQEALVVSRRRRRRRGTPRPPHALGRQSRRLAPVVPTHVPPRPPFHALACVPFAGLSFARNRSDAPHAAATVRRQPSDDRRRSRRPPAAKTVLRYVRSLIVRVLFRFSD